MILASVLLHMLFLPSRRWCLVTKFLPHNNPFQYFAAWNSTHLFASWFCVVESWNELTWMALLVSAGITDAVLQLGSLLLEVGGYYLEWLSHMAFIIQQTSLHLFVRLSQDSKERVEACKSSWGWKLELIQHYFFCSHLAKARSGGHSRSMEGRAR